MMDKLQDGQPPEILFIERCLQFLKPYGRMGIVLPDGLLSNSSLEYVRRWIKNHARILAVVSLPPETFIPHGTGVKASIMFLQKLSEDELRVLNEQGYNVFFASIKKIGYKGDKVGTPLYKRDEMGELILGEDGQPIIDTDVPNVIEAFLKFRVDENLKFHKHGEDLVDAIQRGERKLDFFG
jgi:type I restriction enzyme M protein